MKKLLLVSSLFFSSFAFSGVSVIVNSANSSALGESEVSRIFLGKMKFFPAGGSAMPVNLPEGSNARNEFEKKVLNKSSSQVKAYWSKLVFTGKGTPPKVVGSDTEMIKMVQSNPAVIGYISDATAADGVTVVAKF